MPQLVECTDAEELKNPEKKNPTGFWRLLHYAKIRANRNARWVSFSIERKKEREREDSKMREIILVASFKYMPDPLAGHSNGGHLRPFLFSVRLVSQTR